MTRSNGTPTGGVWSRRDALKLGAAATGGLVLGRCNGRAGQPNVVLVSIDTLRADRLHCYGNPRPTSPCIDRLASEGLRFSSAFSTAPWTLPAHLGLFASHEPGKYFQSVATAGWSDDKAAYPIFYRHQNDAPTVASVLRDNGYDTVGFHGAMLTDAVWGLDYGFREYTFSPNDDQFLQASAYIKNRNRRPFFLFVHSYVVHRPYAYESVFGDRAARPPALDTMDFENDRFGDREVTPVDPEAALYGWLPAADEIEYFKTVYDGGVRAADQLLQGLIETLEEESLYEDTLIIVTSDHGEEFWEHVPECSPDHNHSLFDELLRIPLVIKMPGGSHAGTTIDSLARIHDVGPTIYDTAGIPLHAGATGASLLAYLDGRAKDERILYAGCTYMGPTRHCVRTSRYKYIRCPQTVSFRPHFDVPEEALYDLASDPFEQTNVISEQPRIAAKLSERLDRERQTDLPISLALDDALTKHYIPAMGLEEHAARLIAAGKVSAELPFADEASEELLESLRSLGYL